MLKITITQDIYIKEEYKPLLGFLAKENGRLIPVPVLDENGNDTGETTTESVNDAIKVILNTSTSESTKFKIVPHLEAYFGKNLQGVEAFTYLKNLIETSAIVTNTEITELPE